MSNELDIFRAYPVEMQPIETVMRVSAVKRWHMIETVRTQTLAEHSANVALLAMVIARMAPMEYFDTYAAVGIAALVHDVSEVFTGDIPTPTKKFVNGINELELRLTHPVFVGAVNGNSDALIKMCDLADGIRFIRIHRVDTTGTHAQRALEDQLATRIKAAEVVLEWPDHLVAHVLRCLQFYMYERY